MEKDVCEGRDCGGVKEPTNFCCKYSCWHGSGIS